ncbi:MAG: DUF6717 family protein, partial [Candidatus Hodarchaeales archaeon]
LKAEPFVFGIPEIIDKTIETVLGFTERKKFRLMFSEYKLPNYHVKLNKKPVDEVTGAWYEVEEGPKDLIGKEGWLCPATLKYYPDYPRELYIHVEKLVNDRISAK